MSMMTDFAAPRLGANRPAGLSWRTIVTAFNVMRERAALARMSEQELADIGLTGEQAAIEAARPIWDLPRGR